MQGNQPLFYFIEKKSRGGGEKNHSTSLWAAVKINLGGTIMSEVL